MEKYLQTSLINKGLIYLGGGAVGQLVPFLLLPILTRYLTPSDFGSVATFQSALILSFAFIGVNTNGAIVRNYTTRSKHDFGIYIYNCLLILLISVIVALSILLLFHDYAVSLSKIPIQWLVLIPVVALGNFLFNTALSVYRVRGLAFQFSMGNFLFTLSNALVSIFLVVWLTMDWRGRVIGISSANVCFGIMALYFLFKSGYARPVFNILFFKDALLFGSPLILHKLAGWISSMLNRPLLNEFVGLEATGLFFIGCTIASVVTIFEVSFEMAWTPWLYKQLKDNTFENNKKIVQISYLYFIGLLSIVFLLTAFSQYFLPIFLGEKYATVSNYIFLPALAFAFNGMRKVVFGFILYNNKSYLIAITTVITSGTGIALNYCLIRQYGIGGASYAMVLTFLTSFLLTWGMAQKTHPMPWLLLGRGNG